MRGRTDEGITPLQLAFETRKGGGEVAVVGWVKGVL
jgi:hypothetical protein